MSFITLVISFLDRLNRIQRRVPPIKPTDAKITKISNVIRDWMSAVNNDVRNDEPIENKKMAKFKKIDDVGAPFSRACNSDSVTS